jgi:hypothetical protein
VPDGRKDALPAAVAVGCAILGAFVLMGLPGLALVWAVEPALRLLDLAPAGSPPLGPRRGWPFLVWLSLLWPLWIVPAARAARRVTRGGRRGRAAAFAALLLVAACATAIGLHALLDPTR